MKLPKLTEEEKKQFDSGIIQVNGKAMNHTALGIIAAFLHLYPKSTFQELKEAFPDTLNPSGPVQVKTIFKPFTERDFGVVHNNAIIKEFEAAGLEIANAFFIETDKTFTTSDGVVVLVNKLWESKDTKTGDNDLQNLIDRAKKYGIVVNKFEPKQPFNKGSYSLDILNPSIISKIQTNKRKCLWWIIILIAILLIIAGICFSSICNKKKGDLRTSNIDSVGLVQDSSKNKN